MNREEANEKLRDYVRKMHPEGTKVRILGGSSAIAPTIIVELKDESGRSYSVLDSGVIHENRVHSTPRF